MLSFDTIAATATPAGYGGISIIRISGKDAFTVADRVVRMKKGRVVDVEKNTINLENYIYQINNNKYYVYIGITKNDEVLNKITNYYKNLGYNINTKEFYITNNKFVSEVENLDKVLLLTDDNVVIGEVISQGLNLYEEVVINEVKN